MPIWDRLRPKAPAPKPLPPESRDDLATLRRLVDTARTRDLSEREWYELADVVRLYEPLAAPMKGDRKHGLETQAERLLQRIQKKLGPSAPPSPSRAPTAPGGPPAVPPREVEMYAPIWDEFADFDQRLQDSLPKPVEAPVDAPPPPAAGAPTPPPNVVSDAQRDAKLGLIELGWTAASAAAGVAAALLKLGPEARAEDLVVEALRTKGTPGKKLPAPPPAPAPSGPRVDDLTLPEPPAPAAPAPPKKPRKWPTPAPAPAPAAEAPAPAAPPQGFELGESPNGMPPPNTIDKDTGEPGWGPNVMVRIWGNSERDPELGPGAYAVACTNYRAKNKKLLKQIGAQGVKHEMLPKDRSAGGVFAPMETRARVAAEGEYTVVLTDFDPPLVWPDFMKPQPLHFAKVDVDKPPTKDTKRWATWGRQLDARALTARRCEHCGNDAPESEFFGHGDRKFHRPCVSRGPMRAYKREEDEDGAHAGVFLRIPETFAAMFPPKDDEDTSPAHFTLLYFGPIEASRLEELEALVRDVARKHAPFEVEFAPGVEWFTNDKGQEIAHKSVTDASLEALRTLHDELRAAGESAGFPIKHHKDFIAHATLAYQEHGNRTYDGPVPEGSFPCAELELWGWDRDVEAPLAANDAPTEHDAPARAAWRSGAWRYASCVLRLEDADAHEEREGEVRGPGLVVPRDDRRAAASRADLHLVGGREPVLVGGDAGGRRALAARDDRGGPQAGPEGRGARLVAGRGPGPRAARARDDQARHPHAVAVTHPAASAEVLHALAAHLKAAGWTILAAPLTAGLRSAYSLLVPYDTSEKVVAVLRRMGLKDETQGHHIKWTDPKTGKTVTLKRGTQNPRTLYKAIVDQAGLDIVDFLTAAGARLDHEQVRKLRGEEPEEDTAPPPPKAPTLKALAFDIVKRILATAGGKPGTKIERPDLVSIAVTGGDAAKAKATAAVEQGAAVTIMSDAAGYRINVRPRTKTAAPKWVREKDRTRSRSGPSSRTPWLAPGTPQPPTEHGPARAEVETLIEAEAFDKVPLVYLLEYQFHSWGWLFLDWLKTSKGHAWAGSPAGRDFFEVIEAQFPYAREAPQTPTRKPRWPRQVNNNDDYPEEVEEALDYGDLPAPYADQPLRHPVLVEDEEELRTAGLTVRGARVRFRDGRGSTGSMSIAELHAGDHVELVRDVLAGEVFAQAGELGQIVAVTAGGPSMTIEVPSEMIAPDGVQHYAPRSIPVTADSVIVLVHPDDKRIRSRRSA